MLSRIQLSNKIPFKPYSQLTAEEKYEMRERQKKRLAKIAPRVM